MADKNMKTICITVTPEQDKYLEDLAEINQGNKSYFVRVALDHFFEVIEGGKNAK